MTNAMVHSYRHIEVRPIAGAPGAEIHGVQIARPLESEVVSEIRQAFLDHLVIFCRDQRLSPQEQLAFAQRFGQPMEYPHLKGLPECPLITPVIKLEHEQLNFGGVWHSDTTYLERPPMASLTGSGASCIGSRWPATRRTERLSASMIETPRYFAAGWDFDEERARLRLIEEIYHPATTRRLSNLGSTPMPVT